MAFNTVIHGKHYSSDKIKFTGRNTQGNIVWKCSGDSYEKIYDWLVDHEVITLVDEDPICKYILKKLGKTYNDYMIDDDEIDFNRIYLEGTPLLTDEAYKEIISNEDGNAYYQEWE